MPGSYRALTGATPRAPARPTKVRHTGKTPAQQPWHRARRHWARRVSPGTGKTRHSGYTHIDAGLPQAPGAVVPSECPFPGIPSRDSCVLVSDLVPQSWSHQSWEKGSDLLCPSPSSDGSSGSSPVHLPLLLHRVSIETLALHTGN